MNVSAYTLGSLVNQTMTTLEQMDRMIFQWKGHLLFILLGRKIAAEAGAITPPEETEAIVQWVRENMTYRRDPDGIEMLQDPVVTLNIRAGDCDDLATLAGTLLAALGHPVASAGVVWKGQQTASHAVVIDRLTRLVCDPVAKVPAASWPPDPYILGNFIQAGN